MRIILEGTPGELRELAQRLDAGERVVLSLENERLRTEEPTVEALSLLGRQLYARGLRPRLVQLVELDLAGYTRQEIADALKLSLNTVDTYWRDIYRTLQCSGRSALRALARQIQNER